MECNHIFIFSNTPDEAAEELIDWGLNEGPNRIHPGQGTRNRKFYIGDFYLEILWVYCEDEMKSDITRESGLPERADFENSGFSPFGMCLYNFHENDTLFTDSFKYKPVYLPKDMAIEVVNVKDAAFPWTFRWPTRSDVTPVKDELAQQKISELTSVNFEIVSDQDSLKYLDYFKDSNEIHFQSSQKNRVILQFDNMKKGQRKEFSCLPLVIEY